MRVHDENNASEAIAAFAWLMINRIRMAGLSNLADVTRFTGLGMAAPGSGASPATGEAPPEDAAALAWAAYASGAAAWHMDPWAQQQYSGPLPTPLASNKKISPAGLGLSAFS